MAGNVKYWECAKCQNLNHTQPGNKQEITHTCAGCARPKGADIPTCFKENPLCQNCEDKTKCSNPVCLCISCVGRNSQYCSIDICPYLPDGD